MLNLWSDCDGDYDVIGVDSFWGAYILSTAAPELWHIPRGRSRECNKAIAPSSILGYFHQLLVLHPLTRIMDPHLHPTLKGESTIGLSISCQNRQKFSSLLRDVLNVVTFILFDSATSFKRERSVSSSSLPGQTTVFPTMRPRCCSSFVASRRTIRWIPNQLLFIAG